MSTSDSSNAVRTFLAATTITGVVGLLGPSSAIAQTQNADGIMTCSIDAFYIPHNAPTEKKEVIATVQQPANPETFAHGFESAIDTILGMKESGAGGANIICKNGVDRAFTFARAQAAERPPNNIPMTTLRVDFSYNSSAFGNRGVARSRYMGPMGDKSYRSDLPTVPVPAVNGLNILNTFDH
jgi:hypothetical protein